MNRLLAAYPWGVSLSQPSRTIVVEPLEASTPAPPEPPRPAEAPVAPPPPAEPAVKP